MQTFLQALQENIFSKGTAENLSEMSKSMSYELNSLYHVAMYREQYPHTQQPILTIWHYHDKPLQNIMSIITIGSEKSRFITPRLLNVEA